MSRGTDTDPFNNETELLKQIALFQRKAKALDSDGSTHKQDMRDLYLQIVSNCRHDLSQLASAQGENSLFHEGV